MSINVQDYTDEVALDILARLAGRPPEAVYELTVAELALLRERLELWTVKLSQVFADHVGDLSRAQTIMQDMIGRPEKVRADHAKRAQQTLNSGKLPRHREFAAFILSNASDQFRIEDEIKRREGVQ